MPFGFLQVFTVASLVLITIKLLQVTLDFDVKLDNFTNGVIPTSWTSWMDRYIAPCNICIHYFYVIQHCKEMTNLATDK